MNWKNAIVFILLTPNPAWTWWGFSTPSTPMNVCANMKLRADGYSKNFAVPMESRSDGHQLSTTEIAVYDHREGVNLRENLDINYAGTLGSKPIRYSVTIEMWETNRRNGLWEESTRSGLFCFFNVDLGPELKSIDAPAKKLINPRVELARRGNKDANGSHPMLIMDVEDGIGGKPAQFVCEMPQWYLGVNFSVQKFLDGVNNAGIFKQPVCPAYMEKVEDHRNNENSVI